MRPGSYLRNRTLLRARPWYDRDGGRRFACDQQLVARAYPNLAFRIDRDASQAFLEGSIILRSECGVPADIAVRVAFPHGYPGVGPRAYDAADRFPHIPDRHFYEDGQCCLWLDVDSSWDASAPDGLVLFLHQVAIFLDRQLVWEALPDGEKGWPGGERGHGAVGYRDFVLELLEGDRSLFGALVPVFSCEIRVGRNDSCPCGSGMKYKRCHERIVEKIRQRVGVTRLRALSLQWTAETSSTGKQDGT